MMAEIEAKQREVERIVAEEAKKNVVPPLIEVLEEAIEDSNETERIAANLAHHFEHYVATDTTYLQNQALHSTITAPAPTAATLSALAHADAWNLRETVACMRKTLSRPMKEDRGRCVNERAVLHAEAEYKDARATHREHDGKMLDKKASRGACFLLKAQLDAAKKDAEWKIQSFKIIDALTQRVAALEARLDAKETVPLGTPVLGSDPDSCEDSCVDSCEGAAEPVRRTFFPYW